MKKAKTGVELIAEERQKQIDKHGFDSKFLIENPKYYENNQLIYASSVISRFYKNEEANNKGKSTVIVLPDNWDKESFRKLYEKPHKERLIIAGALIASELDRLQEMENKKDNK